MREKIRIDSNQGKKRRITYNENNGEDIISKLPECIISRILSLLPTKDVLRTCVLSKEWEYKWTGIYNIDINDGQRFLLKKTRKASFVNFVDRIFFLSRNSSLKRFRLWCRHEYNDMISWISAALMRNVEDLEIVYNDQFAVLPGRLFDCTSFTKVTKLKLQWPCIFRVSAENLFPSLKILYLAQTKILGEHVPDTSKLMFDFPVLETLELRDCEWLNVNFVEINSPALTKIKVINYSSLPEVDKYQIKISGAKLAKFGFYGYFVENFDLSTSSVFSAAVDFRNVSNDIQVIRKNWLQARPLLKGFSGLNHLILSGELVAAVAQSEQGPPLPKFNMLIRLEVSTSCNSKALLDLLHAMPFLESITLNMCWWDDYDYDEVESVPSCIVSHLNEVQFCEFSGSRPDVLMADFLLTNALQLKKMLGLYRRSSEERKIENFWAKLKSVFKDGDFVVSSCVKSMADFELMFGPKAI